jgi:hypothetical protein
MWNFPWLQPYRYGFTCSHILREHPRRPNKADVAQVVVGAETRVYLYLNQHGSILSFNERLGPLIIASSIAKNTMGQQASVPKTGAEIQVIGAGLPRTGTSSFSAALGILLDGPTYHGGTQISRGAPIEVQSWIRALKFWAKGDSASRIEMQKIVRQRLNGYTAVTDAPCSQFVPELLEIYPNAKVICTTRDPIAWEKSMIQVQGLAMAWFLRAVLLPLPGMRHFVDYTNQLDIQWERLYGVQAGSHGCETYARHIAWLKENVPEDRLVFFEMKDGWEPLCKVLGKKVPEGVPFPRINDSEAIERTAQYHIKRGLVRWGAILAVVSGAVGFYVMS